MTVDHIRDRLWQHGISQNDLARAAGYTPPVFSRYLSGRRRRPSGFDARVEADLSRLEAAEQAAAEARDRVLAGPPEAA